MAAEEPRTTVIRPSNGWFDIDLMAIWRHRDLMLIFARRDIAVKYRQTILGPIWLLVQPLALTFALTTVISGFAGVSTDAKPAPIFYLTSLLFWSYFSTVVQSTAGTFHNNREIFAKVYFPRLTVPLSALGSALVASLFQLVLALAFLLYYRRVGAIDGPTWRLLLLPLAFLQLSIFALGVGLWIAIGTAKYRDLSYATPLILQLWMFVTPIIYPFSAIPEQYRTLAALLNPLSTIVELGRWCFLGTFSANPTSVAVSVVVSLALCVSGVVLFYRVERRAMDTI